MTSRKVISGAEGSRPSSFSATMTCAELETGEQLRGTLHKPQNNDLQ
jgi:hypothetical protein